MKNIITLLTVFLMITSVFAQSPEKMSYQAVIRDSGGELLANTLVGIQISILQGGTSGSIVYAETQTSTTNANGLVSIEIGSGTVESGSFSGVNWANGTYYIKTETDPSGGTDYSIIGTSQLLSVPYALYAKTAESVSGTITETDPSVPSGSITGEIQYWDGTAWVTLTPGSNGQVLTMAGGVPTWKTGATSSSTIPNITNPTTGKTWMDRNLGASQVAISSTDANAYGDLYQWGRGIDGHEKRTSSTTTTLSNSDTPGHSNFIISSTDWLSTRNDNLWQGVNGANNPCPNGYRIPTLVEWEAEYQSWIGSDSDGAFNSSLKLPMSGYRFNSSTVSEDVAGVYWTSTTSSNLSYYVIFESSYVSNNNIRRGYAFSVRCIKD